MWRLGVCLAWAWRGSGGGLAQLGEHLLCKQGVIGSIPIVSTILAGRRAWAGGLSDECSTEKRMCSGISGLSLCGGCRVVSVRLSLCRVAMAACPGRVLVFQL